MLESASNRLPAGPFLRWHLGGVDLAFLFGGHPTAPPDEEIRRGHTADGRLIQARSIHGLFKEDT